MPETKADTPKTTPDPAARLLAALGLTEDADDATIRESFLAVRGRPTAFLDQAEGDSPAA